ncbi:MAG TPA: hypothetical protein VFV34_13935 [Blastocatellia bacterium]|nr:hypothetical protein [Blastocatellia bacterium]
MQFRVGDDVAYAAPSGMQYGTVTRVLGAGDTGAVEIEFEDGRKEIKKTRDRALSLLRRASGAAEVDETRPQRKPIRDPEVERIRRSEQRKR